MYYFVGKAWGYADRWYVQRNHDKVFNNCQNMAIDGTWNGCSSNIKGYAKTSRDAIRILKRVAKSRLVKTNNIRVASCDVYCFEDKA